jgi:hypothetical protein
LRNAKYALDERSTIEKIIEARVEEGSVGMARIVVTDKGVGIVPENLTRIFAQGFTTRKGGHGFGLHSAANAAQEMRGSLIAQSHGLGSGATFVLELPLAKTEARGLATRRWRVRIRGARSPPASTENHAVGAPRSASVPDDGSMKTCKLASQKAPLLRVALSA